MLVGLTIWNFSRNKYSFFITFNTFQIPSPSTSLLFPIPILLFPFPTYLHPYLFTSLPTFPPSLLFPYFRYYPFSSSFPFFNPLPFPLFFSLFLPFFSSPSLGSLNSFSPQEGGGILYTPSTYTSNFFCFMSKR